MKIGKRKSEQKYNYQQSNRINQPITVYSGVRGKIRERLHIARKSLNKENIRSGSRKIIENVPRYVQKFQGGVSTAQKYAREIQGYKSPRPRTKVVYVRERPSRVVYVKTKRIRKQKRRSNPLSLEMPDFPDLDI